MWTNLCSTGSQCLVIGEITCDHLMVVLNKTDLIEETKRDTHIAKVHKSKIPIIRTPEICESQMFMYISTPEIRAYPYTFISTYMYVCPCSLHLHIYRFRSMFLHTHGGSSLFRMPWLSTGHHLPSQIPYISTPEIRSPYWSSRFICYPHFQSTYTYIHVCIGPFLTSTIDWCSVHLQGQRKYNIYKWS